MIGKLAFGALITAAVIVGMVAQAGAFLLELTSPRSPAQASGDLASYAQSGPSTVGVRTLKQDEAPVQMTVWYPAIPETDAGVGTSYSYAINMMGTDTSVALATYGGRAQRSLAPDLSDAPYPMVILSHGFATSASSYAWLAEHLAAYGLVVVAPHHAESLDPGTLWRSTIQRPRDIAALLAHVDAEVEEGGEFEGLIDPRRLAVVGHSYGGYTALAVAGAQLEMSEFDTACSDARRADEPLVFLCDALVPRMEDMARLDGHDAVPAGSWPVDSAPDVDAVISMAGDAAMFGETGLSQVAVPVMAIGGTADTDSPLDWGTRFTYDHVSSLRKVEITLQGAGHMIFAGGCDGVRRILNLVSMGFCSDPAWDRNRAHDLVKHHATAFLLAELAGDPRAEVELAGGNVDPFVGYRVEGY